MDSEAVELLDAREWAMMQENAERGGLIMKGLGRKAKATADADG